MPLSPAVSDPDSTDPDGEPQPGSIPAAYAAAIAVLLGMLAAEVTPRAGVEVAVWAERAVWGTYRFRARVRQVLAELGMRVAGLAGVIVESVFRRGATEAAADTRWRGPLPSPAEAVARGLVDALTAAHPRVERTLEETYRRAVDAAAQASGDPRAAVQRVLNDLASRGITGYVDRAGRNWSLETYVETTVRAQLADAALGGYVDVCRASGYRFAAVSVNLTVHHECRVWEGKVLSLDGTPPGTYVERSPAGRPVTVVCHGTLEWSRASGLWHPWCQHWLTAVIPGGGTRVRRTRHIDREARARRRYLARNARAWDRRTRVAITPQARDQAQQTASRWRSRRR